MNNYNEEIRRFNRFYTRIIGVNNQYNDRTKYSAAEAQLLYEIYLKGVCTAAYLCEYFSMDKGYLSRILKRFEGLDLILKKVSPEDKRIILLELTERGNEELDSLIATSNKSVSRLIHSISADRREELIECMKKIQRIFTEFGHDKF
jgi:DNA-binding MarR family transcriptional regulator